MKVEFLKGLGLEDETIAKIQAESGKDIQKEKDKYADLEKSVESKDSTIAEKDKTIKELNDKISKMDDSDTKVKELQETIDQYEKAEKERKDKEAEQEAEASLRANFEEVVKDKNFVNDYTKESIFNEVKTLLAQAENKGKGITDIFNSLTKDKEGIFASSKPTAKFGSQGGNDKAEGEETTADYIRNALFGNKN